MKINYHSLLEHPSISFQIRADHRTLYELALESNNIIFANQPLEEVGEDTQTVLHDKNFPLETLFNVRPEGNYPDHKGNRHPWSQEDREDQLSFGLSTAIDYKTKTDAGVSSQQATQWLTMNVLQNSIASGSLRSWLQLLDSHSRSHKIGDGPIYLYFGTDGNSLNPILWSTLILEIQICGVL